MSRCFREERDECKIVQHALLTNTTSTPTQHHTQPCCCLCIFPTLYTNRVMQDSGFGHPARQPHSPHSLQHVLLSLLQDSSSSSSRQMPAAQPAAAVDSRSSSRPQSRQQGEETPFVSPLPSPSSAAAAAAGQDAASSPQPSPAAAASGAAAVARGFVNRLFSTLNWTLTEFTVAVGELHTLRGQRSILEVQNQYRRTGLMFELSVNFLRLLEFVVVSESEIGESGV